MESNVISGLSVRVNVMIAPSRLDLSRAYVGG